MAADRLSSLDLDGIFGKGDLDLLEMQPMDFAGLDDLGLPPLSPTAVAPFVDAHSGEGSGSGTNAALPPRSSAGGASTVAAAEAADREAAAKDRMRAKNRRAQARYREKQKEKRAETEAAVTKSAAEVERLRVENDALGQSKEVMESVLTVRDHSAALLDRSAELAAAQAPALPALHRLRGVAPDKDASTAWKVTEVDPASGAKIADEGGLIEEQRPEAPCPIVSASLAEIKALRAAGHEGMQSQYRAVVEALTDALAQLEDSRTCDSSRAAATEVMEDTLWATGIMCFDQAVAHPTAMQKLMASAVGEAVSEAGEVARWAAVEERLELTPAQCAALQPMREVFLARAGRIAADRRRIFAALAAAVPEPAPEDPVASLAALQDTTLHWLRVHQATQELEANMMEEHVAVMEFVARGFGALLTPLQKARALAESYPQFPDVFAIATAAAARAAALPPAQLAAA